MKSPWALLGGASVAVLVAWAAGCGSDSGSSNNVAAADEDASLEAEAEAGDELPAPKCNAGYKWAAGTVAFKEASEAWGLTTLSATGVRINAVDYDGDGWTDLIVRTTGSALNDYSDPTKRTQWVLRNNGKLGFEDVTQACGMRKTRTEADPTKDRGGEVVSFGDVDNDGDLDAYTGLAYDTTKSMETSELMLNKGDGTFELGPDGALRGLALPANDAPAAGSFVDFDRDGNLDIWIPQTAVGDEPQQNRLYKGDGKGGFVDVTIERGLETTDWSSIADLNQALAHTHSWSGVVCDLNNDGNPELLAASYGRAPNHLWQNTGPGGGFTFTNRSIASGYSFDDRQDWTDNENARCYCACYPTAEDCAGVPAPKNIACDTANPAATVKGLRWNHSTDREIFRLGGNSGATMCTDVDNDGWPDLVTSEIVHWDVGSTSDPAELLLNTKETDVRFTRPGGEATGLKRTHAAFFDEGIMTGSVFDFDNDGWADVFFGDSDYPNTRALLYQQDSPGHFVKLTSTEGVNHKRSHGVVVADFDHDGDLDVVVGHSLARCDPGACYPTAQIRYFENVVGQGGNFVQIALKGGAGTNRAAIGARVTLKAGGVTQTRDVEGGHGHFGAQDDLTLHFGLGAACDAEVTVRWPDAALTTETFKLVAGYRFSIEQGGKPKVVW
jgi:enediyne biosynthesis protein E4